MACVFCEIGHERQVVVERKYSVNPIRVVRPVAMVVETDRCISIAPTVLFRNTSRRIRRVKKLVPIAPLDESSFVWIFTAPTL